MPLSTYLPDEADRRTMQRLQSAYMDDCLAPEGHAWLPGREVVTYSPTFTMRRWFGIPREQLERDGFAFRSVAADANGSAMTRVREQFDTESEYAAWVDAVTTCLDRARSDRLLWAVAEIEATNIINSLAGPAYDEGVRRPEVVGTTRRWADCMTRAGTPASDPGSLIDASWLGSELEGSSPPSPRHLEAARAYGECDREVGLWTTYRDAERAEQKRLVDEHERDLRDVRQHLDALDEARPKSRADELVSFDPPASGGQRRSGTPLG